jgi:MoaA/NifB/PqqE/SkfB family radical SAM enzyme
MGITAKIDRITRISPEYLHATLPAPKSVKIELTNSCNFRCGFCALRTREKQTNERMDFSLFQRITTEMREAGVEEIGVFYLGESLMAPDLTIEAVKWCKHLGFPYVFLTTNGSLATGDVVEGLMAAGIDSLKFSVNAGSPDQFSDIMAVKPSLYWDALENIAKARRIRDNGGYKCGIYASSIAYDGEQSERMSETLKDFVLPYVDEHYYLPLYSMGSLATQREEELGYRPTAGNQGRLDAMREPLPCWSAFTEGHVTASGQLSACCFDATSAWVMGDLTQQSFMEAWNSPDFVALREAHLRKDVSGTICEQCVAYG